MEENQIQFLPFQAINEFMRDDFRLVIIRSVLTNLSSLPDSMQDPINRLTRKIVKVPGFRNSEKAPATVKLLPMASAFQKNADLVAAILAAWAELNQELRTQVYEVLKERGWPLFPNEIESLADLTLPKNEADWSILPPAADRTRLPGFVIYWPAGQTYEEIYQSFSEKYPQSDASIDKVSLMSIWLAGRLPYKVSGEENKEQLDTSL
jgi:hypothetical protein